MFLARPPLRLPAASRACVFFKSCTRYTTLLSIRVLYHTADAQIGSLVQSFAELRHSNATTAALQRQAALALIVGPLPESFAR